MEAVTTIAPWQTRRVPRTEDSPRVLSRALLRGGAAIAAATGAMNFLTYGYMIITAHAIGKEAFGAFSALMGALLVVNVLSLGLQATGARRISSAPHQTVVIERMVLAVGVRSALLLGAACLVLAPLLNLALHLNSLPTALLLGLAVAPLTYMGAQAGVLQGERRWGALSLVYVAQGLGRVLVGVALMLVWPTEFWAFAGVVVGSWLPVAVGYVALRRPRAQLPHHSGPPVLEVLHEISHSSQALLAFFALSNVDILVARASLSDAEAGLYAGGLIMAKAILFLPQFVVVMAFPSMASKHSTRYTLLVGLGISLILGLIGLVGILLLPELAVVFVGGQDYVAISDNLWMFAAAGTILAMVQLLVYSTIARQQLRAILLTWCALAAVIVGALMVDTALALLLVVIGVDGLLLLALLAIAFTGPGPVLDAGGVSREQSAP